MADVLHATRERGAITYDFAVVKCPHCPKEHRHAWRPGSREEKCIKTGRPYIVVCVGG